MSFQSCLTMKQHNQKMLTDFQANGASNPFFKRPYILILSCLSFVKKNLTQQIPVLVKGHCILFFPTRYVYLSE